MHCMFLDSVAPSDVLLTTHNFKQKLSHGFDGTFTKLLKETISNILQTIPHVINKSFVTGIAPQDLKIAKVVPIYKFPDKRLLQDYRPVSLLPANSKILEKIMYKAL